MNQLLAKIKEVVKLDILIITPEMADKWLKTSIGNRKLKPDVLKGILSDLVNDEWAFNGASIVFDENGALMDGHHRLTCIRDSNKPAISVVVSGVHRDANYTIDSGSSRSLGDDMNIANIPNYNTVSVGLSGILAKLHSNTNGIHTLGSGNMLKRSGKSRRQAFEYYYQHQDVFQTMASMSQKVHRQLKCFRTKEIMIISCYLVLAKNHSINQVIEFWNLVYEGSEMFATLRSVFMNDFQERRYKKMSSISRYSYIATVWNYYIQKHYVKRIKYNLGEYVEFI